MKENKQKKATKLHNTYRIKKWERKQYIKKCESNTIKDVHKGNNTYNLQDVNENAREKIIAMVQE